MPSLSTLLMEVMVNPNATFAYVNEEHAIKSSEEIFEFLVNIEERELADA